MILLVKSFFTKPYITTSKNFKIYINYLKSYLSKLFIIKNDFLILIYKKKKISVWLRI